MSPNEVRTRKELIDPALVKVGWTVNDPGQVGIEIPVDGYDAEPWNGVTDYCFYWSNGEIIAVIEAKKQVRDPNVAREQGHHYKVISSRSTNANSCCIKVAIIPACRHADDRGLLDQRAE